MNNFYILFFDTMHNYNKEESIVQNVIEKLCTFYYRNAAIKISNRVLLINVPQAEVNKYPLLKDYVEEAIQAEYDLINTENRNDIKTFILPVQLKDIEQYKVNYKK